jgi:mycothiol synthase
VSWITGLHAGTVAAVRHVADAAESVDGVAPLSGHLLEALGTGQDNYILASVGPRIIGVAVSHHDDPIEFVVAPEHRREGLGTELLHTALARIPAVWAHGDLPAARSLAGKAGLIRTRELLQMRRPLSRDWAAEQVAAAAVADGVRLRTFVPGQDEEEFLGVNARAFEWHPEQGRLDLAALHAEMAQPWFDPAGFFLAVDTRDDTVLGFHWTKVHADGPAALGEVYVLGVDPLAAIGGVPVKGLGAPLLAAGLDHLASAGLGTVLLYVEGDNEKALRLYRRLGFETFATDVVYGRPN